jgi:hypothetical protein
MVALFWAVMSAAGLLTEYLFRVFGLVPESRPVEVVEASFQWTYTTILNILFIGVFFVLYWLSRNQKRLGGGAGYATDPVCGMQVQTSAAPATAQHAGHTYYFCSDSCRERFVEDPERYTDPGAQPGGMSAASSDTVMDPVCGMTIDPEDAAATCTFEDETYHFCSNDCARTFDQAPARYRKHST